MTRGAIGAEPVERAFDPTADLPAMVRLIADVNRNDDIPYFPTVADLQVDWAPAPTFDPTRDVRVIADDDRFVGAARHGWRERGGKVVHTTEVWVHPEWRRRGLGRRLLAWAETRARDSVARGVGGPRELPHVLGMGTGADFDPGLAFAEAAGYFPVRYSFEMRRDLAEPIPDVDLPAGLEIRPVTPEQHRRIWAADIEAFQDHWEAAVRHDSDFEQHFGHPNVDTSLWLVAWAGDEVAGSVQNGIYPEENAALGQAIGWLDHVSVRRPWRGRGLASALIVRSLVVLRDRGMDWAALGVDAENPTGALGLYERFGFRASRTWVKVRKPL
jgi:mycothiol synthase